MVDENRIEGPAKNVVGNIQDAVGGVTGDLSTQAKGKMNQAVGTVQETFGSAKESAGEWSGNVAELAKEKPLTALLVALSIGFVLRLLTHTSRQ